MGIMEALKIIHFDEGKLEGLHDVVENLIVKLGLTNRQTADIANVSISFVKDVRKEIEAKKLQNTPQQVSLIDNKKLTQKK